MVRVTRLLVVDDEPAICWALKQLGEREGLDVAVASSAEQGLADARQHRPNVVMLDVRLPGIDGLTALRDFRELLGPVPVIVMTAHGSLDVALRATRSDALEYLVKPFDLATISAALTRALESARARKPALEDEDAESAGDQLLVGNSRVMQEVYRRIALAALADVPVLLEGESGTGKELAAREIHRHGPRNAGPFVAVNIAALSPALAESELFGHARGAFTGADQARNGLLAMASGGTLFLDEVADIPLAIQVKLLRALELGEVLPVGASQPVPARFRIIAASHRDLRQLVARGEFRHDLYFRLAGFRIELPALRDRPADIADLAGHFLGLARSSAAVRPQGFSEAALAELAARPWAGNVRELRSAIGHACLMARGGRIEPHHFPAPASLDLPATNGSANGLAGQLRNLVARWTRQQLATGDEASELHNRLLNEVEPPLFEAVLESHRGQVAAAARQLGLHRTTLRKKLDDQAGERGA